VEDMLTGRLGFRIQEIRQVHDVISTT